MRKNTIWNKIRTLNRVVQNICVHAFSRVWKGDNALFFHGSIVSGERLSYSTMNANFIEVFLKYHFRITTSWTTMTPILNQEERSHTLRKLVRLSHELLSVGRWNIMWGKHTATECDKMIKRGWKGIRPPSVGTLFGYWINLESHTIRECGNISASTVRLHMQL